MGIKSYIENNQTLWSVYVHVRSSRNRAIRKQLHARDLKTKVEAIATERKLLKEASEEVARFEGIGLSWQEIIGRWEMAMRGPNAPTLYQPTTIQDHASNLHRWTKAWLNRPASSLTLADGRSILKEIEAAGKSRSFRKNIKYTVGVIYKWGIEEGLIPNSHNSPMQGLSLGAKGAEKVPDILTIEEIRRLLAEAKSFEHPWYPVWAMALLTGMRNGELHALSWSDVDLNGKRITVSKSFNTRMKAVKSTKAGYWRTVPVSDELLELLLQLKVRTGSTAHVLPRHWEWDKGEQARILRKFCLGIGIRSIRFHALRACFATQLLAHDIAPARVMKICGWRDLKTMQHYIRLAGIEEHGATQVLKVLPSDEAVMAKVVNLFDYKSGRP